MQTDGTWLNELGVTVRGEPFKHILIHSVLPYSNWEWGRIAQSESLAAIRRLNRLSSTGFGLLGPGFGNPGQGDSRKIITPFRH
jgi:hypothetical protein